MRSVSINTRHNQSNKNNHASATTTSQCNTYTRTHLIHRRPAPDLSLTISHRPLGVRPSCPAFTASSKLCLPSFVPSASFCPAPVQIQSTFPLQSLHWSLSRITSLSSRMVRSPSLPSRLPLILLPPQFCIAKFLVECRLCWVWPCCMASRSLPLRWLARTASFWL